MNEPEPHARLRHPTFVQPPRVNPVGVVETPAGYTRTPRQLPGPLRIAAAALLLAFGVVGTATTVQSLGRYCLTSQASAASPLQQD